MFLECDNNFLLNLNKVVSIRWMRYEQGDHIIKARTDLDNDINLFIGPEKECEEKMKKLFTLLGLNDSSVGKL